MIFRENLLKNIRVKRAPGEFPGLLMQNVHLTKK